MEPEEAEVCLRCVLKHATRRGSSIFEIFHTRNRTISWQAEGVGWSTKERGSALRERCPDVWQDIKYQGIMAKAPPCPERSMKTPLPQQSSYSTGDEESQWISVEDRRRRRAVFGEMAQRMLRCLEDSEDQKRWKKQAFPQCNLPSKHGMRKAERFSNFSGKERRRFALLAWRDGTRNWRV